MTKKYINFEIEDAEITTETEENSQFATAKIHAFSDGKNMHSMICSEDVLVKTSSTIDGVPILYNFENSMFGKSDFGTHTDVGKNLIAGFVVPKTQSFFKLDDGSNRTGLEIVAKIWKHYSPDLMNIFKRKSKKSVSVEMELTDFEEGPNGLIEMKDFVYHGICVLGDLVTPASPSANMEMVSFAVENEKIKQAYELEFSRKTEKYKTRYSEIDFSIPETVKTNAKRGLDIAHSNGRSGAVYMAIGNHLSKSDKVASDKVRYINKNIHSKRDSELEFMLMGGEESIEWSNVIVGQMNEKDSKMVSYFGEDITFPYTSKTDMNPALKGIDPPISLGQANQIAKVADASSWGIAISQFKKTHHVEDGHWAENEKKEVKQSMDENKDEEVKEETMAVKPVEKEQEMAAEKEGKKETVAEEKKESPADEEKKTLEEEKAESPAEEKAEKKAGIEKKMSLDAYMDVAATMGFLIKQTEQNRVLADRYASGELEDGELCSAMYSSMCKMSEDLEKYAAENDELKKFKADIEKERFALKVESFMQEMSTELSAEEFAKAKEDSANFSMDNIDDWKNKVKVTAFNFSRGGKEKKKQDFVSIAMPFAGNQQSNSGETKSPWIRKQ